MNKSLAILLVTAMDPIREFALLSLRSKSKRLNE